jgi:NTP pyrophosphatase (non-canonical NTP hydrolase)
MTLHDLRYRLAKWHEKRFGTAKVDALRQVAKLFEEGGELAKAVLKGDDDNAAEEVADCLFVLLHICRALNLEIMEAAEDKLLVIERRLDKQAKD